MDSSLPPRIALGHFPTPVESLARLSAQLGGPDLYVKRDDQTGLATGGNKTRKLEFIVAEAMARGCDHLVTLGGPQSNHCRQTAAAAAVLGLGCSVVLSGHPPGQRLGNLLLDELLGAEVLWSGARTREEVAEEVTQSLRRRGRRPYLVPLGGSTGLGALGYVVAMQEALTQLSARQLDIDMMIVASSSAGTQAGLVLGATLAGYRGQVLGISIDASAADLAANLTRIALDAAQLLGCDDGDGSGSGAAEGLSVHVNADYLGGGYSVVGDLERDAIRAVARAEGISARQLRPV
jgi:1-aminocyclopropane-1-carboxylate deaminase/D-cysteine desulfhydrase-like pyridoxal-dependent ACC family enzyme